MTEQGKTRHQWGSKFGFILATAGAAIGLGNLWKFPYLMGRNGGFAFLVLYLLFVVVLGLPIMITEMAIGRMSQQNPVNAYRAIDKKVTFVGVMGVLAAFIVLSYYSVIGGWILKYIASYATTLAAPADFNSYIAQPGQPVLWHILFMLCAMVICYKGAKGIEKASTIMMPTLLILMIAIVIRSLTLPGAMEGVRFIFTPKDSKVTFSSITAAMGQVFYSLSLGMGITVTYGSYLNKKENIPKSCLQIAGLDTLAAVMAGLAIFPAVFALGMEPGQGPGLIFGTLPGVFKQMMGGPFFALLFFALMFFAALTSAIALLECVVSYVEDSWAWGRKRAVLLAGVAAILVGIPSSLSFGILSDFTIFGYTFFDFVGVITDNLLMPLGGLVTCIYVGWFWGPGKIIAHMESNGVVFRLKKAWIWSIRVICPVLVVIIMALGLRDVYLFITG